MSLRTLGLEWQWEAGLIMAVRVWAKGPGITTAQTGGRNKWRNGGIRVALCT